MRSSVSRYRFPKLNQLGPGSGTMQLKRSPTLRPGTAALLEVRAAVHLQHLCLLPVRLYLRARIRTRPRRTSLPRTRLHCLISICLPFERHLRLSKRPNRNRSNNHLSRVHLPRPKPPLAPLDRTRINKLDLLLLLRLPSRDLRRTRDPQVRLRLILTSLLIRTPTRT